MRAKNKIAAAVALAAVLLGAGPAPPAGAAEKHAPCTTLALSDLRRVIDGCQEMIDSGALAGEDLAEALRHQGDAFFRSNRVDLAFENYERALELRPDWPRALWNYGNAAGILGNRALSLQSQRRALEIDPTFAQAHTAIGIILSYEGNDEGAVKEYGKALELDPGNYHARLNRAIALKSMGHFLDALHDVDALFLEDEDALNATYVHWTPRRDQDFVSMVRKERASILLLMGSFDEAVAELAVAIERKPGFAPVVLFRSQLIRSVQGYEHLFSEALADLDRALALEPDDSSLLIEKAALLADMDKGQASRAVLADTARLQPWASGHFFMDRSHVWEQLKEFDRAEADLNTSVAMDRGLFQAAVDRMVQAGYLMEMPGLDPDTALANAISACVRDSFC